MVRPSIVFIGSSKEADDSGLLDRVRNHLIRETRNTVFNAWKWAFDLGETNIEALEKAARTSDFAVMVVTPDDLVVSREKQSAVPRDNIVFELGLFMGALGRDRCFILSADRKVGLDQKANVKLPSDLLGITTARFDIPVHYDPAQLDLALQAPCNLIGTRMTDLGARYKPSRESLAAQLITRRFCESIEGTWWEYIRREDTSALSFFRIEPDPLQNSVILDGKSYDKGGNHIANWTSVLAKLADSMILYTWAGSHTTPQLAHVRFHGYGEIKFDRPSSANRAISTGDGRFWNVDEHHPERTIVKPTQVRRETDERTISTMTDGSPESRRVLVLNTLSEWSRTS